MFKKKDYVTSDEIIYIDLRDNKAYTGRLENLRGDESNLVLTNLELTVKDLATKNWNWELMAIQWENIFPCPLT